MRSPRIDSESSLPPNVLDVVAVKDSELQTEPALQFFLPLEEHRRRAGDHDLGHLLAHKQLPGNQAGLNRLAEADIVGDEQVYARQPQSLAQQLELIWVEANSCAKRRLQQVRVRRCDAIPPEGLQIGRELLWRGQTLWRQLRPRLRRRGFDNRARVPRARRGPVPARRRQHRPAALRWNRPDSPARPCPRQGRGVVARRRFVPLPGCQFVCSRANQSRPNNSDLISMFLTFADLGPTNYNRWGCEPRLL
jgi:hypothetical protein